MNECCYICNTRTGVSIRNAVSLFENDLVLKSGKKLITALSEIVDKKIVEESIHTKILCKKCQKAIVEYDALKVRVKVIKSELIEQFKKTLPKHNLNYEAYNEEVSRVDIPSVRKTEAKKLVLPASKLHPLPPDFMLRTRKFPLLKPSTVTPKIKNDATPSSSGFNVKVAVGSSVLNQSINAKKPNILTPNVPIDPKPKLTVKEEKTLKADQKLIPTKLVELRDPSSVSTQIVSSSTQHVSSSTRPLSSSPRLVMPLSQSVLSATQPVLSSTQPVTSSTRAVSLSTTQLVTTSIRPISSSKPLLTFNVNTLPKDFLTSSILKVDADLHVAKPKEEVIVENEELESNDDQPMEIDEDYSLAAITKKSSGKVELEENVQDYKPESEYLDLKLLGETEGQYVLGKLQILDNEDDVEGDPDAEEHTIVMDGENGSIIRVVSGQKLVYSENGEIALVPDDDLDNNDNGDSQDSNEESQIELQVSGDEETANAIIAAAQEQGGAFIKVESGEMYRVQSVESKTDEEKVETQTALQMILHKDGQFRCLMCERNSGKEEPIYVGNADATMHHLKESHSARMYICRVCGHMERKRSDYLLHIEMHNPNNNKPVVNNTANWKYHECTVCKKKYNSRVLLSGHMNIHNGARPYSCHICSKSFASKYTHQSHLKTHLDRPRPYKCKQCSKSFFTSQNLSQHEKTHSTVKDFVCNICGKAFGTQHNLEVHGVVHSGNKPYVCGVCGKAFARRAEVRDHMRIHTGERPFKCDICGACFTQRSNLHSHKRATHLDDKRYHCNQCPKRFKRRRLLDYHIKASHTGERPLKCEVCHATFVYPEHYKKHARIHSGEKPYTCEVCGKSFNSRDNRNTHRFVHSDRKPYECVICGAGYMRKQLLYHHMNTSGHLAESIVVNQPRVTKFGENTLQTHSIVMESKVDKLPESIYEASEETQEVVEVEVNAGNSSIRLVQTIGESTLPTVAAEIRTNGSVLEISNDTLSEQEEKGEIRLVPIELPDGSSGWVAING